MVQNDSIQEWSKILAHLLVFEEQGLISVKGKTIVVFGTR